MSNRMPLGVFAANMAWHKFLQLYAAVPRLLIAFEASAPAMEMGHAGTAISAKQGVFGSSLAQLSQGERVTNLETLVLEQVASVSRNKLQLSTDEPLMEAAGLDSLAVIELRDQLSRSIGDVPLPVGLVFDYPTVSQLAVHLESVLFGASKMKPEGSELVQSHAPIQPTPSVIASVSCVLPEGGRAACQFWHLLASAKDPIRSVPDGRWDEREYAETQDTASGAAKCYVQCGGFVVGMEGFDASFFRISVSEAKQMDPQQRIVLEVKSVIEPGILTVVDRWVTTPSAAHD